MTRTRTVTALFEIETEATVPLGEIVDLRIERTVAARGFWVPIRALSEGYKGLWSVFTVIDGPDAPVVAREAVEIVHIETDRAFVTGSAREGALVIASGHHRVIPGQPVRIAQRGP